MSKKLRSIRSAMMELIEKPMVGLPITALCGRVITADALFNIWFSRVGKNILDKERMMNSLEVIERIRCACVDMVEKFEPPTDAGKMEEFLRDVVAQLEAEMAEK